jgi:hypothetical protein
VLVQTLLLLLLESAAARGWRAAAVAVVRVKLAIAMMLRRLEESILEIVVRLVRVDQCCLVSYPSCRSFP